MGLLKGVSHVVLMAVIDYARTGLAFQGQSHADQFWIMDMINVGGHLSCEPKSALRAPASIEQAQAGLPGKWGAERLHAHTPAYDICVCMNEESGVKTDPDE